MGYKLPTIFQAESEEARFINVLPIATNITPELSFGGTFNWKAQLPNFNGVHITVNQLYFFTEIVHPLIADTASFNCPTGDCIQTSYTNSNGYTQSAGVETGFNLKYRGLETGLTYTLTDSHNKYNDVLGNPVLSINPLTSKHIVSMLAGYSIKNFFIGLDCYYYSPVKLDDGTTGKDIWEVGISTQYAYRFLLVFANLENIADIRQTSYGPVVFPNPTYAHPAFAQIYGPLEGRLFNAGIKIHLGYFAKKKKEPGSGIEKLKEKDD
jgi:iron complex outermembrane receptor protein